MTIATNPSADSERPPRTPRLGYRIAEWSEMTGTSRVTTWRAIRSRALKVVDYNGIPLIHDSERVRLGFDEA